ncbi:MAG: bifunctional aldolase/short-chain dehydrogenase, partial [Cyanobium sp.]
MSVLNLWSDAEAAAAVAHYGAQGVATPDHVIRTKSHPLVLPAAPAAGDSAALEAWSAALAPALQAYAADYQACFERQNARVDGIKKPLDPLPRVVAIPGLGLVGIGKSAADAAVTADIAETWATTLLAAESIGRFEPVGENDTFDMEYW